MTALNDVREMLHRLHLDPPRAGVDHLSHELGRHARLLHVWRVHMAQWLPHGLDVSASSLLLTLVKCGPRRQGELAEQALLDPSTVSRYVASLVKAGLVERQPDPADGRAVQLVASPAGEQMAVDWMRRRQELIADALTDWDDADIEALTRLFSRLNDDLERHRPPGPPHPADRTTPDRTTADRTTPDRTTPDRTATSQEN
ncbi:MAG: MarR family winged helix-turn-helix transcriptional regulator [Actinomycetales bacterium]